MNKIHPILLAGGSGARLWPLSRKSYPKQFSKLIGDKTLFQQSALRLKSSEFIEFKPHITLTNSDFRFIVTEQLQEVGVDPGSILIEPEAKNTAAAILCASIFVSSKEKDALLLVAPSDHVIPDTEDFHRAIQVGLSHVKSGKIVTFGIQPTHAETGYGYLELSAVSLDASGSADVMKFVEKPDFEYAQKMLSEGNFLWNSGIFLFSAKDMIDAFKTYAPETLDFVSSSIALASHDLGFLRLASEPWSMLDDISIDYAVMEKAQNLIAVLFNSKWSDLGDWKAVWSEAQKDLSGNVVTQGSFALDCSNTFLRAESVGQQIVGLGLENIIAVAMSDAVLVANKERAQDVKKVVDFLKASDVSEAEVFPKDYRPWGWFESLVVGERFQVKRICVKPGAALSLQSHNYRSEHWVVVEGTAQVTIGKENYSVSEGHSIYVPLGALHRIENPGEAFMVLIEVQIGTYLGEDDIVRYEDLYARK